MVQNTSSCMQNEWHHQRNTIEQEAKETIKNCSQEVDQSDSKVYMLLTRSENKKKKKNERTQGLFEKIKIFIGEYKKINDKKMESQKFNFPKFEQSL